MKDGPKPERAFSWFPGHMQKARRQLEQDLRLADAVLFLLDARAPQATRHPDLERSLHERNKPVFLVLNKEDLAEEAVTSQWLQSLRKTGAVVAMTSTGGRGPGPLRSHLDKLKQTIGDRLARKGVRPRPPRLIVAGLPNVGKSSLLNRLVGRKRAKTGSKPGVTRGAQWVVAHGKWQVLDTPGILYPRIEGMEQLMRVAAVGCVKRDVIPFEQAAGRLLLYLADRKLGGELLPEPTPESPIEALTEFARGKSYLQQGEPDPARAAHWLLQSFFEGRLGRISLETPDQ